MHKIPAKYHILLWIIISIQSTANATLESTQLSFQQSFGKRWDLLANGCPFFPNKIRVHGLVFCFQFLCHLSKQGSSLKLKSIISFSSDISKTLILMLDVHQKWNHCFNPYTTRLTLSSRAAAILEFKRTILYFSWHSKHCWTVFYANSICI